MKNDPSHIKASLHTLARQMLGPEWRVIARVLDHWPDIVGEKYASFACPTTLKLIKGPGGSEHGRLTVQIPGALAPNFQMLEPTLIARINRLMGYDFIVKIVFEHKITASLPAPPPAGKRP